ncbi:MAG: GAF domain-containing protein [Chlorobiales bacterium]|jgi:L-methionine (R)-S-oxide reductase|nr:GAF domain-containing protein [Chlorobiales bacterium]
MVETKELTSLSKTDQYKGLIKDLFELMQGESDFVANAANFVAMLYHNLSDVNWAGLYLYKGGKLILGPFQGKPACTKIEVGKGVCGTAAEKMKTIVVKNVHEFPGYITCDGDTNSEIVVPLIREGHLIAVLDLNSQTLDRFDENDKAGLEILGEVFIKSFSLK